MEKLKNKNKKNNALLSTVLIVLIWIGVIIISTLLAWVFDGGQFIFRCVLICPFIIAGIFGTKLAWES